jgi:hypothetical protein
MFQFPGCPRSWLWIHHAVTRYHPRRVAPFGVPRISACPQLPEAFRRVATSFVGLRRQGIHRVPSLQSYSDVLNMQLPSPDITSPCDEIARERSCVSKMLFSQLLTSGWRRHTPSQLRRDSRGMRDSRSALPARQAPSPPSPVARLVRCDGGTQTRGHRAPIVDRRSQTTRRLPRVQNSLERR